MASPEERGQEEAGPSSRKRLRNSQEQNNNTVNNSSQDNTMTSLPDNTMNNGKNGILEWIVVKNFMCHDHLKFEFSPHINFVQGRNGSGKSAILTAVVIGLGGTTRATNRGSSLKDLVKHGRQCATIEIGIKNSGNFSFKPEFYGRSIIVERKITVSSTGGYKLKSYSGIVISSKKDELLRILEHFNLQVDNPVSILNQDMSRSFFNTTDPKILFKLFLKATQLQQLKDDYAELENTIHSSLKIIESRKECLPDLEREVELQRTNYQFSLSLREKGIKLRNLRHELTWAKIIHDETKKEEAEKALENHQKLISTIKEKIEELERDLEQETTIKRMKEKQLNEATKNFEDVAKEVREMEDEMKYAKSDYKDKQGQFLLAEKKMRAITSEISTLREAMEKDNSRAHREWAAARALWQNKIDGVENQVKELLEHCKTETTHLQNLQNTLEVKMSDKRNQDVEERAMRKQLNDLERELKGLQCQKGGQLTVYGHWVPQLLNKIQTAFARGLFVKKPVGPMGAYIKVRDNKWAHVAERVLGKRITGFCVDNQADEKVLRNLMKEIRFDQQAKPIVIVARFRDQVLDVSKFEAFSPDYPSLWSIFDISDSVVANTVVDQMQAESILLIPTSQEAGNLLKDRTQVPRNCKCAYTLNLDQYYPDPNYRVYGGRGSHRAKFLQVSVQDRMREVNRSKEECTERLNSFFQHNQEAQRVIKNLQEEITASNKKSQQYKRKMDTLRMTLGDLQNQETPPLPNIAQLEEDVRQQEESLTVAKANMEKIREESNGTKVKYSELSGFLIAARQREKKSYKEVQTCKRVLDQANANSAELQIKTHKKRKAQLIKEEKNHEKAVAETTEVLDAALKIAENLNIGPRIETQKNIKELERQYNCLQTRLNKERASSGDPVTIAEKYMTTKHRFRQVSEDLNKHVSLMKKLKESLQMRESKYWRLNKWLAVIIKYFFKEHLSLRKLDGSIYVNFDQNTLNIHVEKLGPKKESPVKDMNNKKTRKKAHHQDLIMMSGGERSFATVAFINALWHAIVSPVHILDEFDVFMDVIARNRAMKMMISAAKPDTQYIFLTPLSLDTNKFSSCSFFRMPDERNEDETRDV